MAGITRRSFVKHTAVGAGALTVVGAGTLLAGCGPAGEASKPAAADRVPLGSTGLMVPRVAMGTGTHGWKRASDQTRLGQEAFTRLMAHGMERGSAFIDTADLYGAHPFVKEAMRSAAIPRDQVTLLSKIWWSEAPEMKPDTEAGPAVERFLKEMGVETIDLCLIHCVQHPEWPVKLERMRDGLSALKVEGRIRAVGCSCHTQAALAAAADHPWVDVILARINPEHQVMAPDADTETVARTLIHARQKGKGVIGMKIFGCGSLTGPEQRKASLAYVFRKGLVDAVTIGFTDPTQIDDAMDTIDRVLRA